MSKTEKTEAVKPIIITDNDTGARYEIDYNRESVRFAENRGFSLEDVGRYASRISDLWWYGFRMHHKRITQEQASDLLEKMGGMTPEILRRLIELFNQAGYAGVVSDEEEVKNSAVTVEL